MNIETVNELIQSLEISKVISVLLPLTPLVEPALTGKKYHAFIKDGLALIKQEAKHDN